MRIDLAPLYRSSIGFDRLFDLLENAASTQPADHWPPFDTLRTGEDSYRIVMAVAGFSAEELELSAQANLLVVSGHRKEEAANGHEYLHRGIASRSFVRRFELADHVEVAGAHLANGLLTIDLKRELPEEMKPRRIGIATGEPPRAGETRQIEGPRQAQAA
jgi:molecular chaperone IbpA